jgi:NitT/TauT family transport system substrate-binding protein
MQSANQRRPQTWAAIGLRFLAGVISGFVLAGMACAQLKQVSLVKQYGDSYLPLMLMEHQRLIEKHAEKLGLGSVKVNWTSVSGGASANDALLSGNVDFVSGGVGPMLQAWSATKGAIKGMAALNAAPLLLNTNNSSIKSIRDFTEKDRIAVPAVNVSMQAVTLKMAAAKNFGEGNQNRFDALTVTMTQADATAALLTGKTEVTAHFGNSPFQYQQLENPNIRTVLNSFDVVGGPATFGVIWTSGKFHDENPRLYQAVLAALKEAVQIINTNKSAAAQLYLDMTKSKLSHGFLARILNDPQYQFSVVPLNTMKYAEFMHKIGQIKLEPKSWRDYFFPEIHDLPGG